MLTIGVDPEFAVIDTEKEKFISSHDLVKGTKDAPFKINKGAMQADGTMIEFNIDPAATKEEFQGNIEAVLKQIRESVPAKYEFKFIPTVHYDHYYFDKIPEEAKKLGCTPDFSAWGDGRMNPRPMSRSKPTMRTCSGHMHFGWREGADVSDRSHLWDCMTFTKSLDISIGAFLQFWDRDKERQQLYGKPGAFRPKPYGVEWRTPSNAWLNHKELWPWLFDAGQAVFKAVSEGGFAPKGVTSYSWYSPYMKQDVYYNKYQRADKKTKAEMLSTLVAKKIEGFPAFPMNVIVPDEKGVIPLEETYVSAYEFEGDYDG